MVAIHSTRDRTRVSFKCAQTTTTFRAAAARACVCVQIARGDVRSARV